MRKPQLEVMTRKNSCNLRFVQHFNVVYIYPIDDTHIGSWLCTHTPKPCPAEYRPTPKPCFLPRIQCISTILASPAPAPWPIAQVGSAQQCVAWN